MTYHNDTLPGESAGASLKHSTYAPVHIGCHALPGESAGASLKPGGPQPAVSVRSARTPRRICRGLIEASLSVPDHRDRAAALPGESAGASLKLKLSGRAGRLRPALPGESAGASLKLMARGVSGSAASALPGESAGASLKPIWRPGARGNRRPTTPRRICRGLIEARAAGPASGPGAGHSPANLPGPH